MNRVLTVVMAFVVLASILMQIAEMWMAVVRGLELLTGGGVNTRGKERKLGKRWSVDCKT